VIRVLRRSALIAGTLIATTASVFALVACGGDGGPDIDTTDVDVDALLASAADRMDEVGSFRFELEHENGTASIVRGLQMVSAEGDVQSADTMRLKVEAKAGPLSAELEMIVLPGEGWITNPITGRWEREDIDVSEFFDPAEGVTGLMRSITNPTIAGADTINGVDAYRVEAEVESDILTLFGVPREGATVHLKAWIGVDDPLVYRIEAVGGIVEGEPDNLVRRLDLSDFGAQFDIQAPR
jgi:hypothetical protein